MPLLTYFRFTEIKTICTALCFRVSALPALDMEQEVGGKGCRRRQHEPVRHTAAHELEHDVGNKARADTHCNAVRERHEQHGQQHREALSQLVGVGHFLEAADDLLNVPGEHQEADDNERRGSCLRRDHHGQRGQEHTEQEQRTGYNRCQPCPGALGHASPTLNVGGV